MVVVLFFSCTNHGHHPDPFFFGAPRGGIGLLRSKSHPKFMVGTVIFYSGDKSLSTGIEDVQNLEHRDGACPSPFGKKIPEPNIFLFLALEKNQNIGAG